MGFFPEIEAARLASLSEKQSPRKRLEIFIGHVEQKLISSPVEELADEKVSAILRFFDINNFESTTVKRFNRPTIKTEPKEAPNEKPKEPQPKETNLTEDEKRRSLWLRFGINIQGNRKNSHQK